MCVHSKYCIVSLFVYALLLVGGLFDSPSPYSTCFSTRQTPPWICSTCLVTLHQEGHINTWKCPEKSCKMVSGKMGQIQPLLEQFLWWLSPCTLCQIISVHVQFRLYRFLCSEVLFCLLTTVWVEALLGVSGEPCLLHTTAFIVQQSEALLGVSGEPCLLHTTAFIVQQSSGFYRSCQQPRVSTSVL